MLLAEQAPTMARQVTLRAARSIGTDTTIEMWIWTCMATNGSYGAVRLAARWLAGWAAPSRITVYVNSDFSHNSIFFSQQSVGIVFLFIFQSCRTVMTSNVIMNFMPVKLVQI